MSKNVVCGDRVGKRGNIAAICSATVLIQQTKIFFLDHVLILVNRLFRVVKWNRVKQLLKRVGEKYLKKNDFAPGVILILKPKILDINTIKEEFYGIPY